MLDVACDRREAGRVFDDSGREFPLATERETKPAQHLVFRDRDVPLGHDLLSALKEVLVDHRRHHVRAPNPQMIGIVYLRLPETAGRSVVDEIADIVLVSENRMDHDVGPGTPMVIGYVRSIELSSDFDVGLSLYDELLEYPIDDRDLFVRTEPKPHTVRFQGLVLALRQPTFGAFLLIDHLPGEPERERATNAIAKARYSAVAGVHLDAKLPAELSRHYALDVL